MEPRVRFAMSVSTAPRAFFAGAFSALAVTLRGAWSFRKVVRFPARTVLSNGGRVGGRRKAELESGHDAVAAAALGVVELRVRFADQLVGAGGVAMAHGDGDGDADGHGDAQASARRNSIRTRDGNMATPGSGRSAGEIGLRRHFTPERQTCQAGRGQNHPCPF